MNNYFLAVVKYEKTAEEGKVVKISEQYLVDALTFTEAEKRIIEEMTPFISGEFKVANITPFKVAEIFGLDQPVFEGDKWYKAKIAFKSIDEKGKEKRVMATMLVLAISTDVANEGIQIGMKGSTADYEIVSITETKILDIYKYEA